jgi:hypothetical protein
MTTSISPASLDSLARRSPAHGRPTPRDDPLAAARAALRTWRRATIEVTLAARIIATHHAEVDSYRRAMQPGLSPADITRLRSNAVAVVRLDAAGARWGGQPRRRSRAPYQRLWPGGALPHRRR